MQSTCTDCSAVRPHTQSPDEIEVCGIGLHLLRKDSFRPLELADRAGASDHLTLQQSIARQQHSSHFCSFDLSLPRWPGSNQASDLALLPYTSVCGECCTEEQKGAPWLTKQCCSAYNTRGPEAVYMNGL